VTTTSKNTSSKRRGQKRIQDYPVMHWMLTDLFSKTYQRTLDGDSPKHGFMGSELVAFPLHGTPLDWNFWKGKVGSYRIKDSFVSEWGVTIDVKPETFRDIFLPDTFVLMVKQGTFSISVSGSGGLEHIEMIFEEGMPEFSLDLIRDFPGHNAKSDRVLSHYIIRRGMIPEDSFLSGFLFQNVITIEV